MTNQYVDIKITDMCRFNGDFRPPREVAYYNDRFLDQTTKNMLWGLKCLNEDVKNRTNKIGLIIAMESGPCTAVKEISRVKELKGYIGINPSYFPFIMSSTQLVYGNQILKNHEMATIMYLDSDNSSVLQMTALQLYSGRCELCYLAILRRSGSVFILRLESDSQKNNKGDEEKKYFKWRIYI